MRTTLDLPDELVTEIKILAAQERSSLKDLIAELLRNGLKARAVPTRQSPLPPIYRSRASIGRDLISEIRRETR
jgi:plasmid stability protein